MQLLPLGILPVAGEAEVILDVAVAVEGIGQIVFLELGEDFLVGLAENVDEDIEPAAMSHANDHLLDPGVRGLVDKRFEQRDEGLGTFEGEALLAGVACLQEVLEQFSVMQAL